MLSVKFFNCFPKPVLKDITLSKEQEEYFNEPVLVDDVDTTITSFLKTYGAPPHFDADDFEEGDDKDFDDIDDVVDDDVEVTPETPVESPAVSSPVEPSESAGSAPVEPDQSVKDE